MATHLLLAAALSAFAAGSARAEDCVAGWSDARGAPQTARLSIDWADGQRFDRSDLPHGTLGILCLRASVVPEPEDIRILIELGVSFGVADQDGRSLWIWAEDGRLQVEAGESELSGEERTAVDAWTVAAQRRFDAALARR